MTDMERTFVMLKPDAIQRALIGQILARFEKTGLKLVAMKFIRIPDQLAQEHYREHMGKPFYESLMSYITSGPVVATVWEGEEAIGIARDMMGKTNPKEAGPGTIRGDYGIQTGRNIVHGSDGPESAKREISLFFSEEEIVTYEHLHQEWVYE